MNYFKDDFVSYEIATIILVSLVVFIKSAGTPAFETDIRRVEFGMFVKHKCSSF